MAPIPIKGVISVSSEDGLNPASNLLSGGIGRKWLTRHEEKCRRVEVVLELSKKARIGTVEIGNFGSAFIEIHVCSVTSPPTKPSSTSSSPTEWLTLLPSCMLMTVQDSRAGRNKTATLSCSRKRFSATAARLKCNWIKVICRQPYNMGAQFGLQFVAFYSEHVDPRSPTTPCVTPSPTHNSRHQPSPPNPPPLTPGGTPHRTPRYKLPSLPVATPCKDGDHSNPKTPNPLKSKTPKRPLRDANENEECEFSGVEKQSRLLSNAMKEPRGSTPNNPILERIVKERKLRQQEKAFESSYEKKRLLVKDLPKAIGKSDFAAGYVKTVGKSMEMSAAFRKISAHDNRYEIGQEPEQTWGWGGGGKRRKRRGAEDGASEAEGAWLTKRRKKLSGMISECREVLSRAGNAGDSNGRGEDLEATAAADDTAPSKKPLPSPAAAVNTSSTSADCYSDTDSDATIIMDYPDEPPTPPLAPTSPRPCILPLPSATVSLSPLTDLTSPSPASQTLVQCPLCGIAFPGYAIELHAASCGDVVVTGATSGLPAVICID